MNAVQIAQSINRSRMAKGLIGNAKQREAALAAIRLVAIDISSSLIPENRAAFLQACGF